VLLLEVAMGEEVLKEEVGSIMPYDNIEEFCVVLLFAVAFTFLALFLLLGSSLLFFAVHSMVPDEASFAITEHFLEAIGLLCSEARKEQELRSLLQTMSKEVQKGFVSFIGFSPSDFCHLERSIDFLAIMRKDALRPAEEKEADRPGAERPSLAKGNCGMVA